MSAGNDDFEAKVRRAYAARTPPRPGGKGSPPALLAIGVLGTGSLALVAGLLGGGLLFVPAAIPLATVVLVLAARVAARRREHA